MDRAATILVVDDNPDNRALARETLEDLGHRVALAAGGYEALEAFGREAAHCVLLDVRMPDLDGFATCERLRALPGGADVPVIFVTAQRDVATFDRALRLGAHDFIAKPYRPRELVARVEAALELHSLAAERTALYAKVKRQRDELQRLQLQKEQLIAFLVHDLKNPANAIDLLAQAALREPTISAGLRRRVERIREENRSSLRMIRNLLDVAKADEGALAFARDPIPLAELVDVVFDAQRVRAEALAVQLVREVGPEMRAAGDGEALRRVIENLVDNALRYAPASSVVAVTAGGAGPEVVLRVADAGPGVPGDQRERVFERFAQLDLTTARPNHGLGLAYCKLVATAHGGRIWIEDAAPGAVFCVALPAATT